MKEFMAKKTGVPSLPSFHWPKRDPFGAAAADAATAMRKEMNRLPVTDQLVWDDADLEPATYQPQTQAASYFLPRVKPAASDYSWGQMTPRELHEFNVLTRAQERRRKEREEARKKEEAEQAQRRREAKRETRLNEAARLAKLRGPRTRSEYVGIPITDPRDLAEVLAQAVKQKHLQVRRKGVAKPFLRRN